MLVFTLYFVCWSESGFWPAGGFVYAGFFAVALAYLRGVGTSETGFLLVIFLFLLVWATDVGAFFGGRLIGGKKLAPRISPNKTWSGAITGIITTIPVSVGYGFFSVGDGGISIFLISFGGVFLSIASQLGDLFESGVKRFFHAKDSGSLLPGHGGVMDRFDGLIVVAILMWLFLELVYTGLKFFSIFGVR